MTSVHSCVKDNEVRFK